MYHVRRSETKGELLIKLAQNDNEIADCFHVMKQLRTELEEASFVPLVRELMRAKEITWHILSAL
jgi:hypothetical protein